MVNELPPEQLRRVAEPSCFPFTTTAEVSPVPGLIGQQRATQAVRFGLGIQDQGFNIYKAGPPGTGKTTAIRRFLEEVAKGKEVPPDWCYVNNFADPYRPKALRLPPGRGRERRGDMG